MYVGVCIHEWSICTYRSLNQLVEIHSGRADLRENRTFNMYVCMYVRMYVRMYVCKYVWKDMCVCTYVSVCMICIYNTISMYLCIYESVFVCMYNTKYYMYVCMCTCLSLHTWLHGSIWLVPQVYWYILLRCTSNRMEYSTLVGRTHRRQ